MRTLGSDIVNYVYKHGCVKYRLHRNAQPFAYVLIEQLYDQGYKLCLHKFPWKSRKRVHHLNNMEVTV